MFLPEVNTETQCKPINQQTKNKKKDDTKGLCHQSYILLVTAKEKLLHNRKKK